MAPPQIETKIHVATYDIDFAGIVSNIVYFRWLEDLRFKLLEQSFPLNDLLTRHLVPTVVHSEIDYRKAIKLDSEVRGRMWLDAIHGRKMILKAEFTIPDGLAAAAAHVILLIDDRTWKSVPIPDDIRQRLGGA